MDKKDYCHVYKSIVGYIKICHNDKYITHISIVKNIDDVKSFVDGEKSALSDLAFKQIDEYLHGNRKIFNIPFEYRGTEFQNKVWRALYDIPYGETKSYKDIAIAIGNPKACRAVGMANNKNPIAIVVPCHRVIGANGRLVGYAGGIDIKEKLLKLEVKYKDTNK